VQQEFRDVLSRLGGEPAAGGDQPPAAAPQNCRTVGRPVSMGLSREEAAALLDRIERGEGAPVGPDLDTSMRRLLSRPRTI